jgi:hypothetical protein
MSCTVTYKKTAAWRGEQKKEKSKEKLGRDRHVLHSTSLQQSSHGYFGVLYEQNELIDTLIVSQSEPPTCQEDRHQTNMGWSRPACFGAMRSIR